MVRRPSARSLSFQIAALVTAFAVMLYVRFWRSPGEAEAFAAPAAGAARPAAPIKSALPATSATPAASAESASPAPAASATAARAAPTDAKAPDAAAAPADPIDLAVAPDGGVPTHPGASHYKSPFASPNATQPIKVKVGLLLNSIDDYDIKTGRYDADFFLSLTSEVAMPAIRLAFPNGKVEMEAREVLADKPTFKLYRLVGNFKSPPNLRKYPFDSQELKIMIEDDFRGIDQLRFSVDKERTQLARGFRALGWQVAYLEARSTSQSYPDRFENDDLIYGRYTFAISLERYATSAAFTVFVPAFVIVLISLLGMWVPPDNMEVRSNAGAPMLAAAVLFHFALMQELPATSYLTRADKLMLGVYVSLALGMLSTWWMFLVEEHNVDKVFRVARIAVPALTVLVMAAACIS
ncbi:MAG TPA: hypothetical protein VFK05_14100 [Polyangiaceae bacterium]|nr:hypothetical protein [Polyangiaceae bacterium]